MERFADASRCKELGNERIRAGQPAEALSCYLDGVGSLSLFETSAPILSANLRSKVDSLGALLHSNAAQAALSAGEWEAAVAHARAALAKDPGNKKARWRLERAQEVGEGRGLV